MPVSVEQLLNITLDARDTVGRTFVPNETREFVPNNIPGREAYITDAGALAEFNRSRKDVESLIAYYRSGYPDSALSVGDVYTLAAGINMLPLYLPLRKDAPVAPGEIPASLIDASRAAVGVSQVVLAMQASGVDAAEHVSSEAILKFAVGDNPEGRNFFVQPGDKIQSCPAPLATVKRILDLMVYTSDPPAGETDWSEVVHDEDVNRSLLFGKGLVLFFHCINTYYDLPDTSPDRERYRVAINDIHDQLNMILGHE